MVTPQIQLTVVKVRTALGENNFAQSIALRGLRSYTPTTLPTSEMPQGAVFSQEETATLDTASGMTSWLTTEEMNLPNICRQQTQKF